MPDTAKLIAEVRALDARPAPPRSLSAQQQMLDRYRTLAPQLADAVERLEKQLANVRAELGRVAALLGDTRRDPGDALGLTKIAIARLREIVAEPPAAAAGALCQKCGAPIGYCRDGCARDHEREVAGLVDFCRMLRDWNRGKPVRSELAHLQAENARLREAQFYAAAWVLDRADQYGNDSPTRAAFDEIMQGLADGEHLKAAAHGELDNLLNRPFIQRARAMLDAKTENSK